MGEVLVDFISTRKGTSLAGAPSFAKCAGGAAANVAAVASPPTAIARRSQGVLGMASTGSTRRTDVTSSKSASTGAVSAVLVPDVKLLMVRRSIVGIVSETEVATVQVSVPVAVELMVHV